MFPTPMLVMYLSHSSSQRQSLVREEHVPRSLIWPEASWLGMPFMERIIRINKLFSQSLPILTAFAPLSLPAQVPASGALRCAVLGQ